jgi:hypothetical protein
LEPLIELFLKLGNVQIEAKDFSREGMLLAEFPRSFDSPLPRISRHDFHYRLQVAVPQ